MLIVSNDSEASSVDALLLANETFYAAFAQCDCDAMEDVWSSTADITCIHPGWPAINGRDAVIGSWRSIMQSDSPLISVSQAEARVFGDTGYIICNEHLQPGTLIATNIFLLEDGIWKMIHHQAGITPVASEERPSTGTRTLQ